MIGRAGAACMALCTVLAAASCDNAGEAKAIRVNDKVRHQTIDNFGASDAWTMRFLGEASDKTVRQTADWLFSTECDAAGQPLGIGLSIWRFNLTAGSAEQGAESHKEKEPAEHEGARFQLSERRLRGMSVLCVSGPGGHAAIRSAGGFFPGLGRGLFSALSPVPHAG